MISRAQIQYILALKEHQNFQKAANSCFVTQPTLSMQIKKAEEVLGKPLFDRNQSPLELTSFGKKLLPFFHQVIDSFNALEIAVAKSQGDYKSEIKIGIIPTIAVYLVPELYREWQEKLKSIRLEIIELKSEQILEYLEERKIDMGIMAGPHFDEHIETQVLYNEEICIYAPNKTEQSISVKALQKMRPWLLSQGNCLRTQMINFCNLKSTEDNEWSYEGGSLSLLVKMVQQEGGYTLIPDFYKNMLDFPETAYKKIDGYTPARQVIAIFNKRNSKQEDFKQIIREIHYAKGKDSIAPKQSDILPWK